MSNASVFSSIKRTSAAYRAMIAQIPSADFQTMPSIGGWSYSEVYFHIFDASMLSLIPLEACIKGKGKTKPTAFIVKLILLYGSLPPMKFKAPEAIAARIKKITAQEAVQMIDKFLAQLESDYPEVNHADKNIKNPHPRIGYLNAADWLRFIEIHLKHHYKQLKRIEKSF